MKSLAIFWEHRAPARHWLLGFSKVPDTTTETILGVAKKEFYKRLRLNELDFLFVRKKCVSFGFGWDVRKFLGHGGDVRHLHDQKQIPDALFESVMRQFGAE